MEWINDVKSVAQIAMPILVALIIPYFRSINRQLQELNKQMALSSASMSYLTKQVDSQEERLSETEKKVHEVALVQDRCRSCNPD